VPTNCLKNQLVNKLIFQLRVAEIKQVLQKNDFNHPQQDFTSPAILFGIGLGNDMNLLDKWLRID